MEWFSRVVKVDLAIPDHPTNCRIHDLFTPYGEIAGVYKYSSNWGQNKVAQYFIEFADEKCIPSLVGERIMNGFHLRIYPITSNKAFCDQFKVIARTIKRGKGRRYSDTDMSLDIPASPSTSKRKRENVNSTMEAPHKRKMSQSPMIDSSSSNNSFAASASSSKYELPPLSLQKNDLEIEKSSDALDLASPQTPTSISSSRHEQSPSPPALTSSLDSITNVASLQQSPRLKISLLSGDHLLPAPTLNDTLLLQLHGETISCDLATLANDPLAEGILSLLEACECERDKWIEVAAHYRRQRNAAAAIIVLEGMVRVLLAKGVDESDMKAAYVMLAGCESDLARATTSAEKSLVPANVSEHYHRAAEYLHRVYGKNIFSEDSAFSAKTGSMADMSGGATGIYGSHASASNVFLDLADLSPSKQDTPSRKPAITPDQATRREMQSLRDRNNHLSTSLNSTKNELRSVQNQLRAAEEKIRSLERQISEAKHRESDLKGRLHNEVGRRRLAEETIGRRERLIDQLDAKLENMTHQDRQQAPIAHKHDKIHSESEEGFIQEDRPYDIPSPVLNMGYFTVSNMQSQ